VRARVDPEDVLTFGAARYAAGGIIGKDGGRRGGGEESERRGVMIMLVI